MAGEVCRRWMRRQLPTRYTTGSAPIGA